MQLGLSSLGICVTSATVVAALVAAAPGEALQGWVRRITLILINLTPVGGGNWRSSFSKRETFLGAWFVTFVVTIVVWSLLPSS